MKKTLLLLLGCTVSIFSFADGDGDPVSDPADIIAAINSIDLYYGDNCIYGQIKIDS